MDKIKVLVEKLVRFVKEIFFFLFIGIYYSGIMGSVAAAFILIGLYIDDRAPLWIAVVGSGQLLLWCWYKKIDEVVFFLLFIVDLVLLHHFDPERDLYLTFGPGRSYRGE